MLMTFTLSLLPYLKNLVRAGETLLKSFLVYKQVKTDLFRVLFVIVILM